MISCCLTHGLKVAVGKDENLDRSKRLKMGSRLQRLREEDQTLGELGKVIISGKMSLHQDR